MEESKQWKQLAQMDAFFFYEDLEVSHATQHDIAAGVMQPSRSLFYDREDSVGLEVHENVPISLFSEILMKYEIARWVARRNALVSTGDDGEIDRRVAVSQESIDIESNKAGEVDVRVLFISFADLNQTGQVSIPLGGGT